jgi:aminopeptidase N
LRGRIISLACDSGNQECLEESSRQFKNWINTGQQIPPDVREYAYKYGMQSSGSDEDWNKLWDLWRTEVSASEKSKLLTALTSVTNTQLISKLISYTTDSSIINDQDFFTVQQSIASNSPIGRPLVWNYLRNNWEYLVERFTVNDRRLGSYVSSICSGFTTETQLKEMEDFFANYPDSGAGENARNQALENVRNNIKWLNTHEKPVTDWLDSNSQASKPWLNWRLDSQVIPLRYRIDWNVDLNSDSFSGSVSIEVNLTKPLNYFILHNNGLTITKSEAYTNSTNELVSGKNDSFAYIPNEFLVIPTDETIRPAIYRLYFEFNGTLTNSLSGLYKSVYINERNETKSLATTQMQSTYARKAFPCFDEPQFKSYFDISVTHSSELNAISNMPEVSTKLKDLTVTKFDESVKMVTYLVALVVSDFVCDTSSTDNRVRVCAAIDHRSRMDYALKAGPEVLRYFEKDYFEINYPLPKLDMIAIPDFSAGAMENWGLVTYREAYLLYDENESTTNNLMTICSIIAHELAHMVFISF